MRASEAAKILAILRGAYPSAPIPEETVEIYERMLGDLTFEEAQLAALEHIATHKWFPTISELRQRATRRIVGAPVAGLAIELIRSGQRAKDIHPLVARALELCGGTWEMKRTTNPSAWRAQFRKIYKELVEEACHEENLSRVLGPSKTENLKELSHGNGLEVVR